MSWNKFDLATDVFRLLEKDLAVVGYTLLDVRVFRGGGRVQLRIFVDTDEGITLGQCTDAARTVGMLMEEADPVDEQYVIEVSSPGIRRPLRKQEHFLAQKGQRVEVKVSTGARPRRVRGTLEDVGDGWILVQPVDADGTSVSAEDGVETATPVKFAMTDVIEANLDPEFDVQALINADRRRRKEEKRRQRQEKRQARKTGRQRAAGKATPQ